MPISLEEVRRRILIALFSDDELMNTLVLKGGNALTMVHEVGNRSSLDMDFSIASQFPDLAVARSRVFSALRREFAEAGYVLFDEEFIPKPSEPGKDQPAWWGGYIIEFKLIERALHEELSANVDALRRRATVLGPRQRKIYTIDISKNEYCAAKVKRDFDDYTVYVYSLEMIAIEKLRAICQQMDEYPVIANRRPRARDFYDICAIARTPGVDLAAETNIALFEHIFAAKGVPLKLLANIPRFRAFHAMDWPSVEDTIGGKRESFDHYFDEVVALVSSLKAEWIK
jgi:predicted nucleotidyltransferase component of viral defense system